MELHHGADRIIIVVADSHHIIMGMVNPLMLTHLLLSMAEMTMMMVMSRAAKAVHHLFKGEADPETGGLQIW